jgi:hypothetical protein
VGQHVDEVVGWEDGNRQLLSDGDEALVVEEQPVVVDRLGGNQREVEVVTCGERAPNVRAHEQPRRRRRRAEERVLHGQQLERRSRALVQLVEKLRHQRRHRDAGDHADALAVEPREGIEAFAHAHAERRDGAHAVLDLGEVAVVLGVGKWPLGEQIELVGAEHPTIATLGERSRLPALDRVEDATGVLRVHRTAGVEVRELGHADGHESHAQHRIAERPQIAKRRLEDLGVVEAGDDHHLRVELDAAGSEPRELIDDVGDARIVEQDLARFPRRGVHGDVQRRQPILEDPRDVALLHVGECGEVAVGEGEAVIVVAHVERLP